MISFRSWLRTDASATDGPLPSVGDEHRVYAIGDVHGRADLLDQLLDLIARDDAARGRAVHLHFILLGDLVDRGPSSAQVVAWTQRLMRAATGSDVHLLKGNHEEIFVRAARGEARVIPLFRRIGGIQTLASYGLAPTLCRTMDDAALSDWMLTYIPRADVDFLEAFEDMARVGDYLFVHAGIRPRVPIDRQSSADLRWIRHEFLDHHGPHGPMIVHGHSITDDVDERANRIGIDTGAFRSGRLTAIGLQGTDRWFLQTGN